MAKSRCRDPASGRVADASVNLAHCIHGLGLGGAQKVIAAIVRGQTGDQIRHFVYSCDDGVHREEIAAAGATVRIVPRHLAKLDPLWILHLAQQMRRDRIALVHTHLFGDSLHGYLASRLAGRPPVVMTLHIGPEGLRGLQPRGYGWLIRRASRVISCSRAVGQAFTEAGLAESNAIESIPNGIDAPRDTPPDAERLHGLRQSLGAGPETTLFAVIGRLEPQKGHSDLLAAFADFLATTAIDARLLLLGTGPLADQLEAQAREADIHHRVTFAGFRSDVPELLPALDVVVFSSLYEGLPVALLEAMAAARCIVTTDVPGIVEAVRHQREALVAPRSAPRQLAETLARVAAAPELRSRLGAAARKRFHERFTADAMVRSYQDVYRELLSEGPVVS